MLNKAYINLNTLKQNVKNIKAKLDKNVKFCAVVKADGYGHGASEIASAIYTDCDCFAVAIVEEGIRLRQSGIDKDILVLNTPMPCDLSDAVLYDLTLSIDSIDMLNKIQRECKKQSKRIKLHVKFNTGMNRLGVDSLEELEVLAKKISNSKYLVLDGLFSHLACPQNKKQTKTAQNKFLLANNLIKGYNNNAICHLSASGGLLKNVKSDMVRIGILMYGYKPFASNFVSVKPIMKVYAPLIKKRSLQKGDGCLYGKARLDCSKTLWLVRYGYADGLPRQIAKGQFNNRCMDVTALENAKITKKGVLIMGDADLVAKKYNTISYEVLTKCAKRAQKIYLR